MFELERVSTHFCNIFMHLKVPKSILLNESATKITSSKTSPHCYLAFFRGGDFLHFVFWHHQPDKYVHMDFHLFNYW